MAKNLTDLIYAYENLAYYFGMKPAEFWDAEYREIVRFCDINNLRIKESFKESVVIEEASTDKILKADSIGQKKPKIISLVKETFKEIFEK